jgi:hypothetical protein
MQRRLINQQAKALSTSINFRFKNILLIPERAAVKLTAGIISQCSTVRQSPANL